MGVFLVNKTIEKNIGSLVKAQGNEICNDGIDNDVDGLVDCKDGDCNSYNNCSSSLFLPTPPSDKTWKLVFSDEFEDAQLNSQVWYVPNWGTNKAENAYLDAGNLVLKIDHDLESDTYKGSGANTYRKFEHIYGYYEARVKFPTQQGINSAFWLQTWNVRNIDSNGEDGTEIDIIEKPWVLSPFEDRYQQTVHWDGYINPYHQTTNNNSELNGLGEGYHLIGLWWNETGYKFYIDGQLTWNTNAGGTSKVPQYLWLSTAPTTWVGDITQATLPDYMYVDYVRVYDLNPRPNLPNWRGGLYYEYTFDSVPSTQYPDSSIELTDSLIPQPTVTDNGWVGHEGGGDNKVIVNLDTTVVNGIIDTIDIYLLTDNASGIKLPTRINAVCDGNIIGNTTPPENYSDKTVHKMSITGLSIKSCPSLSLDIYNWWWNFIGEIDLTGKINEINPTRLTIPGDLNGDGWVGISDYNEVVNNFGNTYPAGESGPGDVDGDDYVLLGDYSIVINNLGTHN